MGEGVVTISRSAAILATRLPAINRQHEPLPLRLPG